MDRAARARRWSALYGREIVVILTCSKERVPESTVEFENIEEDMTGRDILTFKCPQCGESHRSLRLG